MGDFFFFLLFLTATIYFGSLAVRLHPALIYLLKTLSTGKVKWPGPRIHDSDLNSSKLRQQLGIGYENLFSTFIGNFLGVAGAFLFAFLSLLSQTSWLSGYVQINSWPTLFCLTIIAFAGGRLAFDKASKYTTQLKNLFDETIKDSEPRYVDSKTAESEYAIEHPLIGRQRLPLADTRALDMFFESTRLHQDGDEMKALMLYQEALKIAPSLHQQACEALAKLSQQANPKDTGPIFYWLGIHFEYMTNYKQAKTWYEKAIDAFAQSGYKKRESRARCNLGNVKLRMSDPSALDDFKKAIELNPRNGIAHINIGTVFYRLNERGDPDFDKAMDAFADAIIADPVLYGPIVISRLREIGYTWQRDLEDITQRVENKQKRFL